MKRLYEKAVMDKHNNVLSTISHDLKSPMIAIIGFSNFLLKEMKAKHPEPRWIDILERITKMGQESYEMVNDILSMAKMEAGKEKLEPEWVPDLEKELGEVVKTFECEATAKEIDLALEFKSSLPLVRWDMERLRYHVLNNLISNALKFTPSKGRVVLSAEAFSDYVILKVEDTGHGIPEAERERIFHRFEQVHLTSSRVHKGAGLGLYNAQLFVTQHHGKIGLADSEKGASFVIELPLDALQTVREEELSLVAA